MVNWKQNLASDYVKRNGLRFLLSVFYNFIWCLFCIGKGRLYDLLNEGVPIIVAHMVLWKKSILMIDFIFSEYIDIN